MNNFMVVYSPTEATSTRHISPSDRYVFFTAFSLDGFRGYGASAGGERHGGGENSGSPVISNLQICRSDIN